MRLKIRKSRWCVVLLKAKKEGRERRKREGKRIGPEGLSGARLILFLTDQAPEIWISSSCTLSLELSIAALRRDIRSTINTGFLPLDLAMTSRPGRLQGKTAYFIRTYLLWEVSFVLRRDSSDLVYGFLRSQLQSHISSATSRSKPHSVTQTSSRFWTYIGNIYTSWQGSRREEQLLLILQQSI